MYGQTMNHDKIFALTPEMGLSFWPASTEIIPLCEKMMYTNLMTAKLVREYGSLSDLTPQFVGDQATFLAQFELTKLGLGGSGNFTISINPISSNITSVGPAFSVSGLAVNQSANGQIAVALANGTTSNDDIIYEYVMDNGQSIERKQVTKKFGQLQNILTDTASALAPTWTNNNWGLSTTTFVSPSSSITDSPNGSYSNSQNKRITLTNPINLAGVSNATITFAAKWELEDKYDYVAIEVSTDGLLWIPQCGKYTRNFVQNIIEPSVTAYTGTQTDWVTEEISLSDYAGQSIKVRFRLSTDVGTNLDGFYFDDFKVNKLLNSSLSTTNHELMLFNVYPNPVQNILRVNSTLNNYDIEIYNLQSQLILTQKGRQTTDIDLSQLAKGAYLVQLKSDHGIKTEKIIKQ